MNSVPAETRTGGDWGGGRAPAPGLLPPAPAMLSPAGPQASPRRGAGAGGGARRLVLAAGRAERREGGRTRRPPRCRASGTGQRAAGPGRWSRATGAPGWVLPDPTLPPRRAACARQGCRHAPREGAQSRWGSVAALLLLGCTPKAQLAAPSTPQEPQEPRTVSARDGECVGGGPGPRVPPGHRRGLSLPCTGAGWWPWGWGGSTGGDSPVGKIRSLIHPSLTPCTPQAGAPGDEEHPDPQPPPAAPRIPLLPRCLAAGHPVPMSIASLAAHHLLGPPATGSLGYRGAGPPTPPPPSPSPADSVGQHPPLSPDAGLGREPSATGVPLLRRMAAASWYHRDISRVVAEELLAKAGRDGCFLVRDSESVSGAYALCLL